MEKSIEVEMLDLTYADHVIIHVNVGKMPGRRILEYLKRTGDSMPLCEDLRKKGINYTLAAVRQDGFRAVDVKVEYKDDTPVSEAIQYDEAMEIVL